MGNDGRKKRCFLLKRRFIRVAFPEGHFIDYPLTEAIEATVKYPDIRLSEAITSFIRSVLNRRLAGGEHDSGMDAAKAV